MTNQITAITFGISLAVMLLTMNAVNVSLATTVNNIDTPVTHGETNSANPSGGSQPQQQPTTLPSGGVKINPGCNAPVGGGGACGGGKIIPIKPPSPTKPDGKCPISSNNMSNTCIFIIKKTVVKHDNTIIVVNGMQLQLLNCTIMNNNQVLCNFVGLNNGAALK